MKNSHVRFNFIMQRHMNGLFVSVYKQVDDIIRENPMMKTFIDVMLGQDNR